MFVLKIDEEIIGCKKEFTDINEFKNAVLNELNERVAVVSIKTNAASNSDTAFGEKL